jgi:hypothetical protein
MAINFSTESTLLLSVFFVTSFTKKLVLSFSTRNVTNFVDGFSQMLDHLAHNLITGDEEKSKCTSLA